jgi:hypothetical protein
MSKAQNGKSRLLARRIGERVMASDLAANNSRGWTPRTGSWNDREH